MLDAGLPYFGICFGNQIFGRALGFGTYKLKYGHRGINQPVMDLTTRKVEITAQNHGFAVDAPLDRPTIDPLGRGAGVATSASTTTWSRASSCARADGDLLGFSVQYHPEAAAGPHDAAYLFDRFVDMMASPAACGPGHAAPTATEEEWPDAAPHRHQLDPGDRLRPDRDRPGLRVRLLRAPRPAACCARRASGSSW